MKNKNNTKKAVELKDAFQVGDLLRIHVGCHGELDADIHVKLTKINKVTAVGILEDTEDEVTLDMDDLYYAKIIVQKEILGKNLLQA
jgi:hypothetical protein